MHIETKFNNGDRVFWATTESAYKAIPCDECGGTGRLKLEGKRMTARCYECGGKGYRDSYSDVVAAAKELTVGLVRASITDSPGAIGGSMFSNYGPQSERKEEYMCIETGIGSGQIYPVEDLFATKDEALARAAEKVLQAKRYREERLAREAESIREAEKEFETDEE